MKTSRMYLVVLLAVVPLSTATRPSVHGRDQAAPPMEELIAEKDAGAPVDDEEDVTSRDGRRVAWRTTSSQKWSVMLNGVRQGGAYDEVRSLRFGPDDQHLAFAARRDGKWVMVQDGVELGLPADDIGALVFSPTGERAVYLAKRDRKWAVVEGGTESRATYADLELPAFTQDGQHLAYNAKPGKKWVVVVDGKPRGGEFDQILARGFSPDGQRVGYVGRRGNKVIAGQDGQEGVPFDIIGGLGFSPDSRRFAYAGANVDRGFGKQKALGRAVIDGAPGPQFEGVQIGSLLRGMATGTTTHLTLGYFNQLSSDTHGVTDPVFSPDSRRVAHAVRTGKDAAAVVVNGDLGPTYPSIVAGPVFSPDSRHVAFVVSDAGTKRLVVDDVQVGRGSEGGTDFVTQITFAPDSRRVAYVGVNGGTWYERGFTRRARRRVYVDGIGGPEYDALALTGLQFTPDGRHLAYVVARAAEGAGQVSFVVIDGVEGKRYDHIYGRPRVAADGRSVSYTVQAGLKFYRVTHAIEPAPQE